MLKFYFSVFFRFRFVRLYCCNGAAIKQNLFIMTILHLPLFLFVIAFFALLLFHGKTFINDFKELFF